MTYNAEVRGARSVQLDCHVKPNFYRKNDMDETLTCPECGSDEVAVTAEQMFMVNSGDHYCHSVKTQDDDSKATCLACRWNGERKDLVQRA